MLKIIGKTSLFSFSALLAASFCVAAIPARAASKTIHAAIQDKTGAKIGEVTLRQEKKGVLFVVSAHGLAPGIHGVHVHAIGKCEGPDFTSSGGHFMLPGEEHGFKNPKGPHLGDLPNLIVKADGTGRLHYLNKRLTLGEGANSLRKAGGTALVIHAGPDDEMSNPSGNSGGRVGCAVLAE